ncbi:EAL domain-containing protein [Marinomonas epiphytica]
MFKLTEKRLLFESWSLNRFIEFLNGAQFLIIFFLVFLLSALSVHFLFISYERDELNTYGESIFVRSLNSSIQINSAFALVNQQKNLFCSPKDMMQLREIAANYEFLDDIGRVVDHEIICSANMGHEVVGKKIDPSALYYSEERKYHYLKAKEDLFFLSQKRALFLSGHTFLTLSPSRYLGLYSVDDSVGAYILDYYAPKVYRTFNSIPGWVVEETVSKKEPSGLRLIVPGAFIKNKTCSKDYSFCINLIDYRIGFYGLSPLEYAILSLFVSVLSLFIWLATGYLRYMKRAIPYRLKTALNTDHIYPLYQPKVALRSGQIVGVEALARWHDSVLGQVPPDVFIDLAEELGIVAQISRHIARKSLTELSGILKEQPSFTLSLNVSVKDMQDDSFLDFIDGETTRLGINSKQVILEITERSAAENNALSQMTREFTKRGFQISLDDFGTGFSNLSWLTKLDSNEIKIDKMFTSCIGSKAVGLMTLNGICRLLENFQMSTVFEGIETQEELDYILEHSPDAIGQGWLFAKAMPVSDLKALLKRNTVLHDMPRASCNSLKNDSLMAVGE